MSMEENKKIYDVMILGEGPAGLTAALYAARGGLSVLVIEKGIDGGQIAATDKVENYPGQVLEGESGESLSGPGGEGAPGAERDLSGPLCDSCYGSFGKAYRV